MVDPKECFVDLSEASFLAKFRGRLCNTVSELGSLTLALSKPFSLITSTS